MNHEWNGTKGWLIALQVQQQVAYEVELQVLYKKTLSIAIKDDDDLIATSYY